MTIHITQGPTLANPEAFDSVPELRRELHRVNKTLLDYSAALEQRDAVGRDFAGLINRVLLQHIAGDFRGVAAILDAQLEASPRLRESLEEARESKELRQHEQWRSTQRDEAEAMPPYNAGAHDPWSMSVDELRIAVDTMNRAGIRLSSTLDSLEGVLRDLTREVSVIVIAHAKGGPDDVVKAVSEFVAKRVVVKDDSATKFH
ncbi:hypothetical protein [Burkholderia sp. BDU5]|uniref:hypothetical protein n=1 Tax=Burkholderia sp. BDU5 TaxID=1385590 RepID=UPI000ADB77DE|nr:hypothetical protein [Burkholderia sp. BDU5]